MDATTPAPAGRDAARERIETEDDLKYRKKSAGEWR